MKLSRALLAVLAVSLLAVLGCQQQPEDVTGTQTVVLKALANQDQTEDYGGFYRFKIATDSAFTSNVRYAHPQNGTSACGTDGSGAYYAPLDYESNPVPVSCEFTVSSTPVILTNYSKLQFNPYADESETTLEGWQDVNTNVSPIEKWRVGAGEQFVENEWGSFRSATSGFKHPDEFWRPYGDSSPFNQLVPSSPTLDSNSSAIDTYLTSTTFAKPVFGRAGTSDYQHPVYYRRNADTGDDYYTINCIKYGGGCEIDGETIQIPDGAAGAGRGDGHLVVINQDTGVEYDLWQVNCNAGAHSCDGGDYDSASVSKVLPAGGSSAGTAVTLNIGYGGKTDIDGADKGTGSDATAAHFGLATGLIRAAELQAGSIEHALVITVPCTRNAYVWPAEGLASTCNSNGPADGAWIQFWGSDVDSYISNTSNPAWKRAIVRAGRDYGMYVVDTGGSGWYFHFESDEAYKRLNGGAEPTYTFGQSNFEEPSSTYSYPFDSSPDEAFWDDLRVIAPCENPVNPAADC